MVEKSREQFVGRDVNPLCKLIVIVLDESLSLMPSLVCLLMFHSMIHGTNPPSPLQVLGLKFQPLFQWGSSRGVKSDRNELLC